MADLKNPFALRDDTVVMIEDVPSSERGLKCKCVCPACKGPFEARLGNIRVHHFAHNGEGCDEEIAYLNGLYLLVQEFILNNKIILPALNIYWSHQTTEFTEDNFFDRVRYVAEPGIDEKTPVTKATRIKIETAEIYYTAKKPIALILGVHSKQMALCIRPPANCCKEFKVKRFKDYATLELNADGISFSELKKEQILKEIAKRFEDGQWIYNPTAIRAINTINENNNTWREQIEKELEAARLLKMAQKQQRSWSGTSYGAPAYSSTQMLPREIDEESGYEDVSDKFAQNDFIVRDSSGQRFVKCDYCGEIKPDYKFASYGGLQHVNFGICRECARRGRG